MHGSNGVTSTIATLGTIRPDDSGAVKGNGVSALLNWPAKPKSPTIWPWPGVYLLDIPRTPYRASEGNTQ